MNYIYLVKSTWVWDFVKIIQILTYRFSVRITRIFKDTISQYMQAFWTRNFWTSTVHDKSCLMLLYVWIKFSNILTYLNSTSKRMNESPTSNQLMTNPAICYYICELNLWSWMYMGIRHCEDYLYHNHNPVFTGASRIQFNFSLIVD